MTYISYFRDYLNLEAHSHEAELGDGTAPEKKVIT
jgi:hypothetical protein